MRIAASLPFSGRCAERWNIIKTTGDAHAIHLHLVQFQVQERRRFNMSAFITANYPLLPDPAGMETGPPPAPSAESFAIAPPTAPPATARNWKDTVVALPGETTWLLGPSGPAAGGPYTQVFTGEYVWHSHIPEHEDYEMMLRYRVLG